MIKLQRFITAAPIAVSLWTITAPAGAGEVIEKKRDVSSSAQFEIDALVIPGVATNGTPSSIRLDLDV